MTSVYMPGASQRHFSPEAMFGNGRLQGNTIKQEPIDLPPSMPTEYPVDMSVSQRIESHNARDSPQETSPNGRHTGSPPSGDHHHNHHRERIQHRLIQGQHISHFSLPPHHYSPFLYANAHRGLPEQTPSRESHKRKQASPMPYPASTPSPHYLPPSSRMSDSGDNMFDMSSDMDRTPGFSKDGRVITLEDGETFQPRHSSSHQRARREFVPDEKKDNSYWCKRLKNNDSARRSRVKRKALEKMMESRLMELQKENIELKHELEAMEKRFNFKRNSSHLESDSESASNGSTTHTSNRDDSQESLSAPTSEKMAREDEELERASAGSDDSGINDDSRLYSVSSVSALHRSLGLKRERTDSMNSSSSSQKSHLSGSTRVPPSSASSFIMDPTSIKMDKTGALDLTSDHSNRSTPPSDDSNAKTDGGSDSPLADLASAAMKSMKNFPLKCRWKREMQSAQDSPSDERRESQ